VAGSWGAVAGNLRFFADRFGTPRAGIEGTTIPYDVVKEYATWGKPHVSVTGPRKHQHLATHRRLDYFGFHLETVVEEIEGNVPPALLEAARDALVTALVEGESPHPDQGRIRRAVADLDEMWRRSGGTLSAISPSAVRAILREQLDQVKSWDGFLRQRVVLEAEALVPEETRTALAALPTSVRLHGDAAPLHYELEDGAGVVRLHLREGQARRFQDRDLPPLDRPVRFAIVRARQAPALGATVAEAMRALRRGGDEGGEGRDGNRGRRGGGGPGRPGGGGRGGKPGKGFKGGRDSQHWRKRR
jgi:ATP-dependent helicase HrpA